MRRDQSEYLRLQMWYVLTQTALVTIVTFIALITIVTTNVNTIIIYSFNEYVSEIGAVVKVVDSHPCGWGSIPGKSCSLFIGLITALHVFWSA